MTGIIGFQGRTGIIGQIGTKVHLGTYVGDDSGSDTTTKFSNIYNPSFAFYEIEINNLHQASDTQILKLRYYDDGGSVVSSSNYQTILQGRSIDSSSVAGDFTVQQNNVSAIQLAAGVGNTGGEVYNASLKLTGIGLGHAVTWTHVTGTIAFAEPSDKLVGGAFSGRYDSGGTFYGFKIYGGQNFDGGTITVYGIKK